MRKLFGLILSVLFIAPVWASLDSETKGFTKQAGFIDVYTNASTNQLYLGVDKQLGEHIYYPSLARGLGSNDIGLDRGQLGESMLTSFEGRGDRVLLKQHNLNYRGTSQNALENLAVEEAFADHILYSFKVVAEDDEQWLIDATAFVLADHYGVADRLKNQKQGSYKANADRSKIFAKRTKAFETNTELEAAVAFIGGGAGQYVRDVAANTDGFVLHLHHSFIALPEAGYQPLAFEPNSGFFNLEYVDYSAPLDADTRKRLIMRHRLEKKEPRAAMSEAVAPIVYYLDRGAPEPVRTALIEGAMWWADAFEAAGFKDAYRVEMLPEGADPMDVRYNMIHWVHRATRGWSYGYSVSDPRTGEILKGNVTLGSLRVRQDLLIAQAMLNDAQDERAEQLALARIRQLSAHEVGHTLGIAHNFAASASDRASVMDYPHPLIELDNGKISLSNDYKEGIGEWDKLVVQYGYGDNPADTYQQMLKSGIEFISDPGARPVGGSHPAGHLWDNGANAADELTRVMAVRKHVLENLTEKALPKHQPWSSLDLWLVPVYNMHRYQIEGAAKLIAGVQYRSNSQTDVLVENKAVNVQSQKAALQAMLATLQPENLVLPAKLEAKIAPIAYGYNRSRENSPTQAANVVDNVAMAEALARHSLRYLLNAQRLHRLNLQSSLDDAQFNADTLINELLNQVREAKDNGREQLIAQRIASVTHDSLIDLMNSSDVSDEVQAAAWWRLVEQKRWAQRRSAVKGNPGFWKFEAAKIEQAVSAFERNKINRLPPGSPI